LASKLTFIRIQKKITSHGIYYDFIFVHNEVNKKVAINYNNNKLKSNQNQQSTIISYHIHNEMKFFRISLVI